MLLLLLNKIFLTCTSAFPLTLMIRKLQMLWARPTFFLPFRYSLLVTHAVYLAWLRWKSKARRGEGSPTKPR